MTSRPPAKQLRGDALRQWIDQYFEGRLSGERANAMFEALSDDDEAQAYFERRQLLAELDPAGDDAAARIGRSLGFVVPTPEPERSPLFAWLPGLSVVGAAAAVLLFVVSGGTDPRPPPSRPPPTDGFSARGHGTVDAGLKSDVVAYRISGTGDGQTSVEVEGSIAATDELAFAYMNPAGKKHLMVWGVDDGGAVYWYHPAWTDAADNPTAVPVARARTLTELPEAIAHDLAGEKLSLFALLTDERPSVRDVEGALGKGKTPSGELLELGTLEVRRSK
jgi:hypothetical protein